MALFGLILSSSAFFVVMANPSDFGQNCKDLFCPARNTCNVTHPMRCVKKDSNITILLEEVKREYNSILVVYNQSGCEASLVNKTKAQEIVQSLKASQLKRCDALKEMRVEIRSIKGTKEFSREGKEQGATYNLERGFKPIFKCQLCSNKQYGAFSLIRGNGNGSSSTQRCLMLDTCRTKQVQEVNINQVLDAFEANSTNRSRSKPKLSEEEGLNRNAVKLNSTVFCAVLLCLLLEILVCVVLHLWMLEKNSRTSTLEIENSTSNPSYQQGLQLLQSSNSQPGYDIGQETYQPPYQPLVVNTRGPGVSTQYRDLTADREEDRVNPVVNREFYQDLVQDRNQGDFTRGNLTHGELENLPLGNMTLGEQRNLIRRNMIHGDQEKLNRENITDEEKTGEKTEGPLYYVLEEPVPAKEDPRSPRQQSDSWGSVRDPLYYVLQELQSRNANDPTRESSSDSNVEPIYYVLENPNETEENTQDDKL